MSDRKAIADSLAPSYVVERHLGTCPTCRARLAEWEGLFLRLSGVGQLAPAEGFPQRVLARLPRAMPAPVRERWIPWVHVFPSWARRWWPAAAAASGVWVAAMAGFALWGARKVGAAPGEILGWAAAQLQEAFWAFVVRAAAALNLPGLEVNGAALLAFVGSLTLLAAWGAHVLYRYATSTSKVRIYA